jgi:alkaline phosphatase
LTNIPIIFHLEKTIIMKRFAFNSLIALITTFWFTQVSAQPDLAKQPIPKNVILIIGDGMDDHQITIARNYLKGAAGRLTLDNMAQRGVAQVLTVAENDPKKFVYAADSANSATAIATGQLTSRGRIATTAGDDIDLTSIIELASAANIKTGLVSNSSVTDATMAAFYAHINMRFCQSPASIEKTSDFGQMTIDCPQDLQANGGLGSIAEQLVASNLDLALGGGIKYFRPKVENQSMSVIELAEQLGFEVLTSTKQLQSAPLDKKWLGLFAASDMPARLRGQDGRSAEEPQPDITNRALSSKGEVRMPEPMICEPNPKSKGLPHLKLMTDRALAHLSQDNRSGFFLMVESALIDKEAHDRRACGSIGGVEQLDEALDSALAFAQKNPNTLIIVTADHSQSAQIVPENSLFKGVGVPVYTPGKLVRLRTPENSLMAINYATNNFIKEEHTGANVPVFSNDAASLPSMLTQADLFHVIKNYLNIPNN